MSKFILSGILFLLLNLTSFAQSGADPSVRARPLPVLAGVGSVFSLTFTIGNDGYVPITGVNRINRTGFGICLGKCAPATANPLDALSGELLNYFDITYDLPSGTGQGGCYEGIQKAGVEVPAFTVFDLYINAVVTTASTNTVINDIGASGGIAPNPTANPQPTDNDFASIYTHTTVAPQPVSLVSFTAQSQEDHTVLLNWKTSWENANKGYIVERSKDLRSYEAVGEVTDVAGTSNSINSYKFVDKSPYRGTSYYRLIQLDLDGSRHTYKAEPVIIDGRYGVYPNPVSGHNFTLELDEPANALLHLYDGSGREVTVSKSDMTELSTKVSPVAPLSAGVYVLTVEERGQTRRYRVFVQ